MKMKSVNIKVDRHQSKELYIFLRANNFSFYTRHVDGDMSKRTIQCHVRTIQQDFLLNLAYGDKVVYLNE